MTALIRALLGDRRGATAIEYGLIAALISVVCIGAMRNVGTNLNAKFTNVKTNLQ